MMKLQLFFTFLLLSLFFVSAQSMSDVEKIILKLQGFDSQIQPPDSHTAKQIYEGLGESEISELLTQVVDESLIQKLWDEIQTTPNKKDLLKAGLVDQKNDELLAVWDELINERDFVIARMDEVSESDTNVKEGFNTFTEELIKKNNPSLSNYQHEWEDLNRLFLDYVEQTNDPEHVLISFDTGETLFFPLRQLPRDVRRIRIEASKITYETQTFGLFVVNMSDMYSLDGRMTHEWEVVGFTDLALHSYDVFISFGSSGDGRIETTNGGFIFQKGASLFFDSLNGFTHTVMIVEDATKAFFILYDYGVYVFFADVTSFFPRGPQGTTNISEMTVDVSGVLTDVSGSIVSTPSSFHTDLTTYTYKFLSIHDDMLYPTDLLVVGNFNEVLGREFTINSRDGIDYAFTTIDRNEHSGHMVMGQRLVLEQGNIHAQRMLPGMSDLLFNQFRIGSTLVDITRKRGSLGDGKTFFERFSDVLSFLDHLFSYTRLQPFLDSRGFWR